MSRSSQCQRVHECILENGYISSLSAARLNPPIIDLPKRISEMRRNGTNILDKWIKTSSDSGVVRYKVYWLGEADEVQKS